MDKLSDEDLAQVSGGLSSLTESTLQALKQIILNIIDKKESNTDK